MKLLFNFFFITSFGILLLVCGKANQSASENTGATVSKTGAVTLSDPELQTPEQKFLSLDKPGEWDKQKSDHIPFVEVREAGTNLFKIKASVAFAGDGSHYTEHLMLINHRKQEIKKADFKRGNKIAETTFELKRNPEDKYYVLAKCSMHDTWQVEVQLPKVKKSED
jgi:desulfoferrodoxin (superoxide reductase-like protein)